MIKTVKQIFQQFCVISSPRTGSVGGRKRKTNPPDAFYRKKMKIEQVEGNDCGMEHLVIQLLLQHGHLSGADIATMSCVSKPFRQTCETESVWQTACIQRWPSLNCLEADNHIQASGGYQRFYSLQHKKEGDVQLGIPSNQTPEFMGNLLTFFDVYYKEKPIFSRHMASLDFSPVPTKNGISYRLPDTTLGCVLREARGSTRQAMAHTCKSIQIDASVFRKDDSSLAHLMKGTSVSDMLVVGRSLYCTFQSEFVLPGIFQATRLSVEIIISLTTRRKARTSDREADSSENEFNVLLGGLGLEIKIEFFSGKGRRTNGVLPQELYWF